MLKAIRQRGYETIAAKYGVPADKILAYFHYHPTYYHLHVHFTHIEWGDINRSCVQLDEAIQNIELVPDYYQRATLVYSIGASMPLYSVIKLHTQ